MNQEKKRDGIWRNNGLEAEFRFLYEHPFSAGIYRIETAAGEHYANGEELIWIDDNEARPSTNNRR